MFNRILAPVLNPIIHPVLDALAPLQQAPAHQHLGVTEHGRDANPTGTSLLVGALIAAGAVAGGYWLHREMSGTDPNKILPPPKDPDKDKDLAAHILPGATLGEAPDVVADIMQPIFLATYDTASDFPKVGEIVLLTNTSLQKLNDVAFGVMPDGTAQDNTWTGSLGGKRMTGTKSPKAIALLVTNVSGEFAYAAYQWALAAITQNESSWESDDARDATIASILGELVPTLDWSQGLQPYNAASAAYQAWMAVKLIGQVAYQSVVNKASASA